MMTCIAAAMMFAASVCGACDAHLADFPRLAGETDDSPRFVRAISAAPNGILCVPKGEYDIASTILVTNRCSLSMHPAAHLVARAKMKYVIFWDGAADYHALSVFNPDGSVYDNANLFIRGGDIDGNGLASCLAIANAHHFTLADVTLHNGVRSGLCVTRETGGHLYELVANNVYCKCTMSGLAGNIGIDCQTADCHFTDCIVVDYTKGIRSSGGANRFTRCHVWGGTVPPPGMGFKEWSDAYARRKQLEAAGKWTAEEERSHLALGVPEMLPGSVAFECIGDSNVFDGCYADTAETGYDVRRGAVIVNSGFYNNPRMNLRKSTAIVHRGGDLRVAFCDLRGGSGCEKLYEGDGRRVEWIGSRASGGAGMAADAAARGEVSVVGIPHSFPDGRIDWLFNPTAKKGPFNPEWTWQLNRMSFWGALADAYSATGDEKYARAFVRQFSDWFAQTGGVPPERDFNCVGSPWRTIEEGIRLSGSWHTAWHAFSKSPSFCGKVREDFVKSAHAQARHLLAHSTNHNWLLLEMTGAYVFALDFPDLPDAEEIRRTALLRFYDAASKQLCPDGLHDEVSLDYHSVFYSTAAKICLRAMEAGKVEELPKGFLELLERGAEGPLAQITPNFSFPCFNDSNAFRASDIFGTAAKLFPSREDFLWAATEGREGAPPAGKTASRFLPYSGIAVMRSGWDRDATYLAFDVGPTGANHVHQDKLSFTFWKGGEELVFDDGGGQYEQSELRRYAISGYDHSTLLVDGLAQNRSSPRVCERPIEAGWRSDDKEDFAFGVYDQGFGPKEHRLARHRREIRFDKKADEFHVSDIVESADGKDHDYTLLFQIDSTNVLLSADSRSLYADFGRGRKWALEMTLPEGAKPETASGRLKPAPAGWFFGRIGTVPDVHPATTLFVKFPPMKSLKAVTRLRAVGVN